jgi:hypothetical protein
LTTLLPSQITAQQGTVGKLKLVKVEKMLDYIEEWPEQLALFNGQGGRPLAYVIRDVIVPPDSADDPPFGEEESVY